MDDDDEVVFPNTIEVPIRGTKNYEWLSDYGLTDQEITTHFKMDKITGKHFYSVKDKFMEFRAVDGRKPKTRSYGSKPHDSLVPALHEYPSDTGSRVVLVEDIVSGIKVARHVPCLCLFGSVLSAAGTKFVSRFDSVEIWLDPDKYPEAIDLSCILSLFVPVCDVVYTLKDPKDYNDEQIKEFIL